MAERKQIGKHPLVDERTADRLPLTLLLSYTLETPGGPLKGKTTTLNLSGKGLAFAVAAPVRLKTRCQMSLSLPGQARPLPLHARVVDCVPRPGKGGKEFQIGVAIAMDELSKRAAFEEYCRFIAGELLKKYLR